ncbi:hypothetical protein GCM10009765_68310 [Fodinicola feengrottensis]|uniref:Uncharacterized protein n=1 Tax=Fodinicola feengrottensis TaxID=435914 RepID=A0ABN2IPN3_9ACTN
MVRVGTNRAERLVEEVDVGGAEMFAVLQRVAGLVVDLLEGRERFVQFGRIDVLSHRRPVQYVGHAVLPGL